jgi:hypothetical protein
MAVHVVTVIHRPQGVEEEAGGERTRGSTRRPSRRGARGGRGSRGGRQTWAPNRADIALQTRQRRDQERQVSDC